MLELLLHLKLLLFSLIKASEANAKADALKMLTTATINFSFMPSLVKILTSSTKVVVIVSAAVVANATRTNSAFKINADCTTIIGVVIGY